MKKAITFTLFSLLALLIAFFLAFAVIFSISPSHDDTIQSISPVEGACAATERFYIDNDGYYTFVKKADSEFKVLQMTDLHFGGGVGSVKEDKQLINSVVTLVSAVKPDLIVLTGDVIFSVFYPSMNLNNMRAVRNIGNAIDALGIPWTVTLGNHDTEDYMYGNEQKIIEIYSTEFKNCIFRHVDTEVFGRSNQAIRIVNNDGTLDHVLMLVDSNDYEKRVAVYGYDYIHEDQIQWYKDTVTRISEDYHVEGVAPSLAYFHIPVNEYETAWNLYEQNSPEVTYNFGTKNEKICPSPKVEKDKFFEEMVAFGSLKETFCGHDHKNNFSLTYKGITLTYSLSMDCLAYKNISKTEEYRGGTLVTLPGDGTHTTKLVYYKDVK